MKNKIERSAQLLFSRYAELLAYSVCALIPIRLSLTYCALVPLITLWIASGQWRKLSLHLSQPILGSFAIFLSVAFVTSWFGVDARRSLSNLIGLSLVSLTSVITAQVLATKIQISRALLLLLVAQSIAATHSVLDALVAVELPRLFVGSLTESGQLALILPLTLALTLATRDQFGFIDNARTRLLVVTFVLPILILALIFNLKRGPWIGCLVACALIFIVLKPRLTAVFLITAILVALTITPVRQRLAEAQQNFFIAGGRSAIWAIGAEMIERYPLGIGFQNSPILRQFDHSIPDNLKHFHSNYINVAVETGLIGLAAFLSWIFLLLRFSWQQAHQNVIALGIFGAILSSQIAGLLEYNFGDSEIKLIYFVFGGILIAFSATRSTKVA